MTREIKFRFWDKNRLMMFDWPFIVHHFDDEIRVTKLDRSDYERIPLADGVLLQFTGLKDKNGKEIYEGDFVKHHQAYHGNFVESVVWFFCGWKPFFGGGDGHYMPASPSPEHCEVIGNIYETPELLKKE